MKKKEIKICSIFSLFLFFIFSSANRDFNTFIWTELSLIFFGLSIIIIWCIPIFFKYLE